MARAVRSQLLLSDVLAEREAQLAERAYLAGIAEAQEGQFLAQLHERVQVLLTACMSVFLLDCQLNLHAGCLFQRIMKHCLSKSESAATCLGSQPCLKPDCASSLQQRVLLVLFYQLRGSASL